MRVPPTRCAVLATALLGACAGSAVRVDAERRVVEAAADGRVSYQYGPVPATWRRIDIEGNDAAWHDDATRGTVHVDHSCERSQDTPLAALAQHLLAGFTARQTVSEETIPFDGREALHLVVAARLDGSPVVLDLYVLKKDGCVYDMGLVAPPGGYPGIQPAFTVFVRGFRTLVTSPPPQVTAEAR